ncbi:hypothetical protein DRO66_02635 [Candidatus Bathyarchaeota archaeon]|nr:MAG: hypothetical protein DRO66_02635 [Candidatus Bathyarchaeota archaeon]
MKTETTDTFFYTHKDGYIKRTLAQQHYQQIGFNENENGVSLTLGDHLITNEYKRLQIDPQPFSVSYSPQLQMILHKPGRNLPL